MIMWFALIKQIFNIEIYYFAQKCDRKTAEMAFG